VEAPILIAPNWEKKFHVHTNAFNMAIRVTLAQNLNGKCDQPIAYASQLLNSMEQNYTTTEQKVLAMVYTLHKFHHCLSTTNLFSMRTTWHDYFVNKPQLFGRITIWLLFFWNMTLSSYTN
jgi:hypothetical protein